MRSDRLLERTGKETGELGFQLAEIPVSSMQEYQQLSSGGPAAKNYLQLLRRRMWLILVFAATVVIIVGIASFLQTPQYDAVGRISVARESSDSLGLKGGSVDLSGDYPEYTMYVDAQVNILQSGTLLLQVAKALHWIDIQGQSGPTQMPHTQFDNKRETAVIERIRTGLEVTRIPRTPIIEIGYSNPDPYIAAAVVNGLMQAYVDWNFKTKYESTMQVSNWLTGQLEELKTKVESSQHQLVDYQKQRGILGSDDKQNTVTAKLDEMNRELTAAEGDRLQKQAIYESTVSSNPELLPSTSENPVIQRLKQQQTEIKNQYAQVTAQLGPAHPKVVELQNQVSQINSSLNEEINKLAQTVQVAYLIAVKREHMLRGAMEAQKQQANQLNESAIQYNILKHDLQSNQQLYDGLLEKLKEASVSAGLRANNIRLVDTARVPTRPSKPNILLNLVVGLLLGCLGGGMLALVLEKFDDTLRTPDEVQGATTLRPIAVIPNIPSENGAQLPGRRLGLIIGSANGQAQKVELISYSSPESEFAECYRALRTSLLLSSATAPPKVILITSSLPCEGKTTSSVNSAIVLAQKGAKVLLIDADLRAPRIHRLFGLSSSRPGLSTLLSGSASVLPVDVIVQAAQLSTLFVLPAGPVPDQGAELLGSNRMKRLLNQWRDQFEYIVIDAAPVLSTTASVALSTEADAVLLTVRSGQTPKDALVRARGLLVGVGAKVMGVILNAVDLRDPSFGCYYYGSAHGNYGEKRRAQKR